MKVGSADVFTGVSLDALQLGQMSVQAWRSHKGKIAMKRISGPQGKEGLKHRHLLRCAFLVALFTSLLAVAFWANVAFSAPAFAASLQSAQNAFTVSPTQGPVGAVISVSGNGVLLTDGTQVSLGYTTNFQTCNLVSGGQSGVVQNSAFSGWFRWPDGTAVGTYGVCAMANNTPFQLGNYQVLSASAPQVSIAPAKLSAGQQATVSGANFLPGGTSVNLTWRAANGGRSVSLGTVSSNATGAFAHTFTVPSRASTGSYTVMGVVGSGSPSTLSATTTFHVDGVTLVAVPTPTTAVRPTATAAPTSAPTTATATSTPHIVPAQPPTNTNTGNLGVKASLFVPMALGSGLLIALALVAGVLVVRRQRKLIAAPSVPPPDSPLWLESADTMVGGANMIAGTSTPWPGTTNPGGAPPLPNPGREYAPTPAPTTPNATWKMATPIPFDPGLAEAMREAQVSLFATPRPPANEEVEVQ